jgi:hypothetical protein
MTTADMENPQALNAFVTAVGEALDSNEVVAVDISTIEAAEVERRSVRKLALSSTSILVTYQVIFAASSSELYSVYYSLTTQLAYAVEYGYFQQDLYYAGLAENPEPYALMTCSALTEPAMSTYTVISADDDYWIFDDKWNDDDLNEHDDSQSSDKKVALSAGAVAGISIAGVAVLSLLLAGLYYSQRHRLTGYDSGQKTTVTGMEVMNPTFDPNANVSIRMPATMELSSSTRMSTSDTLSATAKTIPLYGCVVPGSTQSLASASGGYTPSSGIQHIMEPQQGWKESIPTAVILSVIPPAPYLTDNSSLTRDQHNAAALPFQQLHRSEAESTPVAVDETEDAPDIVKV